jgi:DNA-binding NarL/FixJ family response regulator
MKGIPMTRVLVFDEHAMLCRAISLLLAGEDDLEVAASVSRLDEALDALDHATYDVIVAMAGVRDGHLQGLALARWVHENERRESMVLVADVVSDELVLAAADVDVRALVDRSGTPSTLVRAVRMAANGTSDIHYRDVLEARRRLAQTGAMTLRELGSTDLDILRHLARGATDKEIGAALHLSPQTIRNRVSRLLMVFNMSNRTQLAVLASRSLDAMVALGSAAS